MSFFGSIAPILGGVAGAAVGGPLGAQIGGAAGGMLAGDEKRQKMQQAQDKQRYLAAETARYSPWTGMRPDIEGLNEGQNALAGGQSMGAGMMAGIEQGGNMGNMWKPTPAPGADLMAGATKSAPMAGGYSQSPWDLIQKQPNMLSNNSPYTMKA